MAPEASQLVILGIPALTVVVLSLIAVAIGVASSRRHALLFALGAAGFLAFSALLATGGYLARFDTVPPPFLALVIPIIGLPLWLGLSPVGTKLAHSTPLAWLVGIHAFRFPLELVMHQAAIEGTMPVQMTYTGWNFDIVTGISAIVIAVLAAKGRAPRWLILSWNVLGSVLLFTIVSIAIASLPLLHAFGSEPSALNTWVAYFPFVWLPAGLVSAALFGHIVLWRRLASEAEPHFGSPRTA